MAVLLFTVPSSLKSLTRRDQELKSTEYCLKLLKPIYILELFQMLFNSMQKTKTKRKKNGFFFYIEFKEIIKEF